jgi:flagellar biosynthesis chaperone FliJ
MSTPYTALLSVRQIEEQQAEVTMAEALRALSVVRKVVEQVRAAREAWLGERLDAGMAGTLSGLELAEREAELRLVEAEQKAAAAREALLERQRQRKVVEKLHLAALAAAARDEARRRQIELDELGGRSVGAFSERAR